MLPSKEAENGRINFVVKDGGQIAERADYTARTGQGEGRSAFDRWLECEGIDRGKISDEELCRAAVDFWNDTLRLGETPREFVRMGEVEDETNPYEVR